ncbi:MAG TPA: PRC-barrel domain-containing protein [Chloroflexota bacterium]|nr:PRC-barrel domain-containing protein [Chloroflexota bacterium]
MKLITMGMDVHALDGRAGRVDDVLISAETGQPAFVVVNAEGGLFASDVVVPIESVQNVDDAGVWLALTREQVRYCETFDSTRHGESSGFSSQSRSRYGEDD